MVNFRIDECLQLKKKCLICHPKPFPPYIPPPLLRSSHPIFDPISPIITSTTPRARKSGYLARKEGTCSGKVPLKARDMWFPIRLSAAELQALATLAMAAGAEEERSHEQTLIEPCYVPWDVCHGGEQTK